MFEGSLIIADCNYPPTWIKKWHKFLISRFLTSLEGELHYSVESPSLLCFLGGIRTSRRGKKIIIAEANTDNSTCVIKGTELSNSSNEDYRPGSAQTRLCPEVVAPAGNMSRLWARANKPCVWLYCALLISLQTELKQALSPLSCWPGNHGVELHSFTIKIEGEKVGEWP